MKQILNIGHRGASGYAPENTIISFLLAAKQGAHMIELDVHQCKSGEIVVIHDKTVDRTTNGTGSVKSLSLSEIKSLRIANVYEIPTLREVLYALSDICGVNIEIKNKKIVQKVMNILHDRRFTKPIMVSSNYVSVLKTLQKEENIQRALIFWATKSYFRQFIFTITCLILFPITQYYIIYRAASADVQWINLTKYLARRRFIRRLHKNGYKVAVWTVNKERKIKKMRRRGVEAIMTNYPDRLVSIQEKGTAEKK